MKIHILAGGPDEHMPPLYQSSDIKWVGVDRGVFLLLQQGIVPVKAFGDFDSITNAQLKLVREALQDVELYPAEKDATDLELAFEWALEQQADSICIFGATGGRLDHMFGSIQLLYKGLKKQANVKMIDNQNTIQLFEPGTYQVDRVKEFHYISFVPFAGGVKELTLEGFKYPLHKHEVELGSTLCISNELIQQRGTFSFTKGILMMVRSNDKRCL